jgi:hypothetical protein
MRTVSRIYAKLIGEMSGINGKSKSGLLFLNGVSIFDATPPSAPGAPLYTLRPTFSGDDDDLVFALSTDNAGVVEYEVVWRYDTYQNFITMTFSSPNVPYTPPAGSATVGTVGGYGISGPNFQIIYYYNHMARVYGASLSTWGIKVRAKDAAGNFSAYSPETSYSWNENTPGGHPTSLFPSGIDTTFFTLNWTKSAYTCTYRIFRTNDIGGERVLYLTVGDVATSLISNLTAGVTYIWSIQAELIGSPGLYSSISNNLSVTQLSTSDIIAPTTPVLGSIGDFGGGFLRVSWSTSTDASGIAYYEVYRTIDNGILAVVTQISNTTYEDFDVVNGNLYSYSIRAVDTFFNQSDFSNIQSYFY